MKNKVVIITGASSGIGKACAETFAQKGADMVLAARSTEKLSLIENDLKKDVNILTVKTDVSKKDDCQMLIEKTLEKFGKIDVLINNAGISMRSLFVDTDLSVLKKLMDVNFWGTVYCSKFAMPHLLKTKGTLVGVSSIAGFQGLPGRAGYSASKFAMHGFLDAVRIENLKSGVHVLLVCPGYTASNIRNTALTGDGSVQRENPRNEAKMMSAEEVALNIYHGVVKRKRTIILTGQGKLAVMLRKFIPGIMDKLVYNEIAKEGDLRLDH